MSMIGNFLAVSKEQLDSLIAHPGSIPAILYPNGGANLPTGHLDIDKAWHGIHFLLTGSEWEGESPWSWVILGGTPVGPDIGYGPARYLSPDQVREVAQALANLPRQELANRYDPVAMEATDIYPQIWVRDGPEGLVYLLSYYDEVVKYYQDAAARKLAVLLYLN
jgi:hypothetical protein